MDMPPKTLTLEEYLAYSDGTDARYELVNGVLVEMPTESPINKTIVMFLVSYFLRLGLPYYRLAIGHQLEVTSEKAAAREPDLVVHSEASAAAILQDGKLLRLGMPVPDLVVDESYCFGRSKPIPDLVIEIVFTSSGLSKLSRYQALGIPEVWFWQDGLFSLYRLKDDAYVQITRSEILELAALDMDVLARCVLIGQTSRLDAANEFRKVLRL